MHRASLLARSGRFLKRRRAHSAAREAALLLEHRSSSPPSLAQRPAWRSISRAALQSNQEAEVVRDLLRTLMASSQMMVPPARSAIVEPRSEPLVSSSIPVARSNNDDASWLEYFATLGSEAVEEHLEKETKPSLRRPNLDRSVLDRSLAALATAVENRRPKQAMQAFAQIQKIEGETFSIEEDMVRRFFHLVVGRQRPFDAHQVLQYYEKAVAGGSIAASDDDLTAMYTKLCWSLSSIDPQLRSLDAIQTLVRSIIVDVQQLPDAGKRQCYPILVASLVEQRAVKVGPFAAAVFEQMIAEDHELSAGYLEHLLSHARYNRRVDLPYADILERIVASGRRPFPPVVINALEVMYPYDNVDETMKVLKALYELQSTALSNDERQYRLDISTLEIIGATAARLKRLDLTMLVWDFVDLLGYRPTEAIYENTAVGFAASTSTYPNALTVLSEMELDGHEVSRAMVRSMSTAIRNAPRNLDFMMSDLKDLRQGGMDVTVAQLNVILSAGAERGDIDRTLAILEEYARNNLQPNVDSYGFAFEALGKHLKRRTRKLPEPSLVVDCLSKADMFLTMMEENNVAPNHHVIKEYVELLCIAGEVETATSVVLDSVQTPGLVNSKTLYRVAMANVHQGQIDIARKMEALSAEPMPFLADAIAKRERTHGFTP